MNKLLCLWELSRDAIKTASKSCHHRGLFSFRHCKGMMRSEGDFTKTHQKRPKRTIIDHSCLL